MRHILNHSQMIRPDHIPKIKEFGWSCSIQPQFVESDAPWCLDSVPDVLHDSLYPWKTLMNHNSKQISAVQRGFIFGRKEHSVAVLD